MTTHSIHKVLLIISRQTSDAYATLQDIGRQTIASTDNVLTSCDSLQVEQEADFGQGLETLDLEAEGASKPVTDDNKQHYVDLYVRHLLETSIQRQFDAFQRGFKRVSICYQ